MGLFSANTNEWIIEKKCVKIPTGRRQTNCLCTKRPRSWTWGERELQQGRRLRPGTTNNTRVLTTQPHWCCFLSAKNILMRSLYERRAGILIKKYCDGVISLCQAFVQRKWGKKKKKMTIERAWVRKMVGKSSLFAWRSHKFDNCLNFL